MKNLITLWIILILVTLAICNCHSQTVSYASSNEVSSDIDKPSSYPIYTYSRPTPVAKYNQEDQRTEFFDEYGNLVYWMKWNDVSEHYEIRDFHYNLLGTYYYNSLTGEWRFSH